MSGGILRWWRSFWAPSPNNKALAMGVYLTWASGAPLPKLSLQKWCNKQLGRMVFPEQEPEAVD